MRKIDCTKALHQLIESVRQRSFMKQHSEALLDVLNVKLEMTYAKAPLRNKTYDLQRTERKDPLVRERLLEKLIWKQWNADAVALSGSSFLPDVCRHIQTFQMPLQRTQQDRNWGKVDLVGVTPLALPVVIELKQENANDTPLRMLVEGLAYAVAVRRAWNEGMFRSQWKAAIEGFEVNPDLPSPLVRIPVILLAPAQFWKRSIGVPGKSSKGKVRDDAWSPFLLLAKECDSHGFPIYFAEFNIKAVDMTQLIEKVSFVQLHKIQNA